MSMKITEDMAKDTEFMAKWKNIPKEQKEYVRATITSEAAEYLNEKAFKEFGMHNAAVGMALSKLILKAKECEEKQDKV